MLAGPRMSGCNSAVAPPVVPGGVDRAELAAAELAQTEAALQQRCLDAGVPYLAPGAPGYSMELDSRASAKQRGLARRQRHEEGYRSSWPWINGALLRGYTSLQWLVSCGGVACNGLWLASNGSVVATLTVGPWLACNGPLVSASTAWASDLVVALASVVVSSGYSVPPHRARWSTSPTPRPRPRVRPSRLAAPPHPPDWRRGCRHALDCRGLDPRGCPQPCHGQPDAYDRGAPGSAARPPLGHLRGPRGGARRLRGGGGGVGLRHVRTQEGGP